MNAQVKGKCFQVGNAITAYQIVARPHWKECGTDEEKLGEWLFEDLIPDGKGVAGAFTSKGYNIVVSGGNIGCGGKSNDHPVLGIKGAGVDLVIAESFNRIFYRNAVNLGLPVILCPGILSICSTDDEIECDLVKGTVTNLTNGKTLQAKPLSSLAMDILGAGGLLGYYKTMRDKPDQLFVSK